MLLLVFVFVGLMGVTGLGLAEDEKIGTVEGRVWCLLLWRGIIYQ